MAEVTVDASWRMSRVEFNTPYDPGGTIVGFGEVLLQEPTTPIPGMRRQRGGANGSAKSYGTMQGETVTRVLADVAEEEIEIDGVKVTFSTAMQAMEKFLQKWLVEDEGKPEPGRVPPAEELTPVAVLGEKPPMWDELPAPLDPFAPPPEPAPEPPTEPTQLRG
jgi:hypothetical protein